MSWLKIFSAVLAAILAAWVIISLATLAIWSVYFDYQMASLQTQVERFQQEMSSLIGNGAPPPVQTGVLQRAPAESAQTSKSKPSTSASAVRTNKRMCEFWTQEYQVDSTPKNEAYRDTACLRYRSSLRELNQ